MAENKANQDIALTAEAFIGALADFRTENELERSGG